MSRQTPTSRRSPSILVTDVRHQKAHSAPFVSRRLNSVSVDSLLSNTSEVPSAQRRVAPKRYSAANSSTSNYGSNAHRSRMAGRPKRLAETTPLLEPAANTTSSSYNTSQSPSQSQSQSHASEGPRRRSIAGGDQSELASYRKQVKPVPQLTKSLPSRTSKQSQRLVLIPEADTESGQRDSSHPYQRNDDDDDHMRVTSYLISEGVILPKAAKYLKEQHRARVRLYDEALFADYLLPLLPGNGIDFRLMSSMGDNRTMERMIDISEQGDHHYEYFAASETAEIDPSEPQDFSPRPNDDTPINTSNSNNNSNNNASTNSGSNNLHEHGNDNTGGSSGGPSSAGGNNDEKDTEDEETRKREQRAEERKRWERERKIESFTSHAELFIFNYGVVVFWNFTEAQEKQILADLCFGGENLVIHQYSDQEIQSEELGFTYALDENEKPQIFNDLITLNSNSHMLKLAMSHAMAQSTILCGFEDRMQAHLKDVRGVPKSLALTGKLGLNREQLLKISGRLFKLRVDVNLSSNVLDIPEFFWDSEPSLFPLFNALREYLEIDERVLVLNERQAVFLELTSILGDSIAEFNMDRITIVVIWLIALSICVSLTEIAVRFLILRRASA